MKKCFSKRWLIFCLWLAGIFLLPLNAAACGWWEDPDSYRMACFHAAGDRLSAYSPFFYSPHWLNTFRPDPMENDRKAICEEWRRETNYAGSLADIDKFLFHTPPVGFLAKYNLARSPIVAMNWGNPFVFAMADPRNKAYFEYLAFAKQNEQLQEKIENPWEYHETPWPHNTPSLDPADMSNSLLMQAKLALRGNLNSFLRTRYLYQLMRLCEASGNYQEGVEAWEQFAQNAEPESVPGRWAVLHYGLCRAGVNRDAQTNLQFARAFALSDSKKLRAYQCFNAEAPMVRETLVLCKNEKERGAVLTLQALYNPGPALESIRKVQGETPGSEWVEVLVMREINKLEDWIFTPALTQHGASLSENLVPEAAEALQANRLKDLRYLGELRQALESFFPAAQGAHRNFLALAIAHLYLMDDKPEFARTWMAKMGAETDKALLLQQRILMAMLLIDSLPDNAQAHLDPIASLLAEMKSSLPPGEPARKGLYTLSTKWAMRLAELDHQAEAALVFNFAMACRSQQGGQSDWFWDQNREEVNPYHMISWLDLHGKPADVDAVIAYLSAPATPFLTLMHQVLQPEVHALNDLKGVLAFRNHDLGASLVAFAQVPQTWYGKWGAFREYLDEDPFVPKAWPGYRDHNYAFNRKSFVNELIKAEHLAKGSNQEAMEAAYRAGAAWYNCSWWGNSWMMWSYGWSSRGIHYSYTHYKTGPDTRQWNEQGADYFGCERAKGFFLKVFQKSRDKELKAKAAFMLHTIETHRASWADYHRNYSGLKNLNFEAPSHRFIEAFYTKLSKTQTWEEIHCDRLEDFFRKGMKDDNWYHY